MDIDSLRTDNIRIDIRTLYTHRNQRACNKMRAMQKELVKVHTRIKTVARNPRAGTQCFHTFPPFFIHMPSLSVAECIAFVIGELRDNGFYVKYFHPQTILVDWTTLPTAPEDAETETEMVMEVDPLTIPPTPPVSSTEPPKSTYNSRILEKLSIKLAGKK